MTPLLPIVFRGRLCAAATRDHFYLAPHVEVLEDDHPDRLFVSLMCCHARDVLIGCAPGPYGDDHAALSVRNALIDDDDFGRWHQCDDAVLAERYGVPLDQIHAKRLDMQRMERVLRSERHG